VAGQRQVPAAGDHRLEVKNVIRQAVALPIDAEPDAEDGKAPRRTTITEFYAERQRRVNVAPVWAFFRNLVGDGRPTLPGVKVADYESTVLDEWPRDLTTEHGRVVDRLRPFHAWPDGAAVIYGDLYRTAFVLAYLMAGGAVGMALLPLALGWDVYEPHLSETIVVGAELVLMLGILGIVWLGRHRKWHERFVDYRLAAELVRHLRISAPLGSTRPFPHLQAQLKKYGHPAATWMAWYVRAVERELGLPNVRLDFAHLSLCAVDLEKYVAGQASYHDRSAGGSRRIERRLHKAGFALFGMTAVACAAHVFAGANVIAASPAWVLGTLTFVAGFFPALGSALAGISNQGEFARLAKRSKGMHQRFSEILDDVRAFQSGLAKSSNTHTSAPGTSRKLSALASETAQLMVNEVLDWRIVFLDRPLREP
jgi:hypothetical protein